MYIIDNEFFVCSNPFANGMSKESADHERNFILFYCGFTTSHACFKLKHKHGYISSDSPIKLDSKSLA